MDNVVARASRSRPLFLTAKERQLASALRNAANERRAYLHDNSQIAVNGCESQSVKASIAALRQGPVRYERDKTVFCENDPTDYLMLIVDGAVRSCRLYHNGDRGIAAFYLPGEIFGWNEGAKYSMYVEAAADLTAFYLKRSALDSLAVRDPRVAEFILTTTKNELRRAYDHSLFLVRDCKQRFASFLLDLWKRNGKNDALVIPMSYLDVADYLGMQIETLSRLITAMEREGTIERSSTPKTLILRNRELISLLAS